MSTSSITSKGQVTIPSAIREKYQLQPGDKVLFQEKDGVIILTSMSDDTEALGGCLAQHTNGRKASLDDMEKPLRRVPLKPGSINMTSTKASSNGGC